MQARDIRIYLCAGVSLLSLAAAGCSDGATGAPGVPGMAGAPGAQGILGPAGPSAGTISINNVAPTLAYGATSHIEAQVTGALNNDPHVTFEILPGAPTGTSLANVTAQSVDLVAPATAATTANVAVTVRVHSKSQPSLFRDITVTLPGTGSISGTIE